MVVIAVAGSASRSLPPERGTVRLRLVAEGSEAGAPARGLAALHGRVRAEAAALAERGAVTRWSAGAVVTAVEQRWNDLEDRRERVHVASALVTARFQDLSALARWVGALAAEEGVEVQGVDWDLTAATRSEVEREVRAAAVRAAAARAVDYADAAGAGEIRLVRLWDAGLRPGGVAEPRWSAQAMSGRAGGDGLSLHPEDVEVAVHLTADFEPV